MANVDVDVLIVGGGPVGLTARVLLERWGVRTLLVEKRIELSPFPRSRLLNVRTMEIYRQLGIAGRIRAQAFAPEFGRVRFRDTMHDADWASAAMVGVNAPIPESPAIGVVTSQDRLEPILLAAAESEERFGVELVDLVEDEDGVTAVVGDHGQIRARYVLAADGANSTVRQRLGIDTAGPGALGSFSTVVFDADLSPWSADQPAGVYFTARGSFTPLYPEGGWAWFSRISDDPADWSDLVARAIGVDVPVNVLRVQHWTMNAFVAERFQHGRILLAGDAAHAIPILGGLGMNVGVGDVHNLCWKLAGVVRGWAEPGLLETYEAERHPVAQETLRQTVANTQLAVQAQTLRNEQLRAGAASVDVELPWSEQYFAQLGLVLGATYPATEVTTEYVPVAEPGHRMPHLWLDDNRSTLDACGEWFTLLTRDPSHWKRGIAAPWPLRVEALPDVWDLPPRGALLVRPDGYISGRWDARPSNDAAITLALSAMAVPGR